VEIFCSPSLIHKKLKQTFENYLSPIFNDLNTSIIDSRTDSAISKTLVLFSKSKHRVFVFFSEQLQTFSRTLYAVSRCTFFIGLPWRIDSQIARNSCHCSRISFVSSACADYNVERVCDWSVWTNQSVYLISQPPMLRYQKPIALYWSSLPSTKSTRRYPNI